MANQKQISEALKSDSSGSVLVVVFIPSKTEEGEDLPKGPSQQMWANATSKLLGELFGGSTEMPPARGSWLNPETDELIFEEVILVHSYTSPANAEDAGKLKKLAEFLHRMGRELHQGEIALVVDGVFHRIKKSVFAKKP